MHYARFARTGRGGVPLRPAAADSVRPAGGTVRLDLVGTLATAGIATRFNLLPVRTLRVG